MRKSKLDIFALLFLVTTFGLFLYSMTFKKEYGCQCGKHHSHNHHKKINA